MLKLAGIDNPGIKALIGVVLVIAGVVVHGPLLMAIGGVLAAWGIVGVAGTLLGRER
jgi:energy-coupling factor transporter transmembrane protein EcfT